VRTGSRVLLHKLERHKKNLSEHFRKASEFLVKCQIIEPYVDKGKLYGCVCPWEIGESADEGAFPILEDFHDTLEAIWVWSYCTEISDEHAFKPNIDWAWEYIIKNWNRFIGTNQETAPKSLYGCSYVLHSGTLHKEAFNNESHSRRVLQAGNRLQQHLVNLKTTEDREYRDPFWMAHCLASAARRTDNKVWLKTARRFVEKTIVKDTNPFSKVIKEPRHVGPGGHDFFSKNANKALALISSIGGQSEALNQILTDKFLPCLPRGFVPRHADENAWNAHLATAIGKSYAVTGNVDFLKRYFAVVDELKKRDTRRLAALPRAPSFGRLESWVTFFLAHAYASVL
jgi:hypothetical protein